MLYICKVHYDKDGHGCEVISHVMASYSLIGASENVFSKQSIIELLCTDEGVKTKYLRCGTYVEGDNVMVVDNNYIRTDGNDIKQDNLGKLPRY